MKFTLGNRYSLSEHRVQKRTWVGFLMFTMALIAIGPTAAAAGEKRLGVFVSILPQQDFVRRIAGDLVEIRVMVPPGASPHTYEPKPRQMQALTQAQLYLAIGVAFENVWLPKIAASQPRMRIIPTDHGIEKIPMADPHEHGNATNDNDPQPGSDPHIWLSPPLVQIMAGHILNALVAIDPDHEAVYQRNYRLFSDQIKNLDDELHRILEPLRDDRFIAFHPSWGYFARTYGLVQIPIEVQGKAPKPAQLQQLIQLARALDIHTILVQPQFSQKSAGVIADAIGGRVVTADPLAEPWADNLRQLARQLQTIVR